MMNESTLETGWQFGQYPESQPESTQNIHHWLKRLEAASVGVIVAFFLGALYLTVRHELVHPLIIPIAWFTWAASSSLLIIVIGLQSVVTGVFPPAMLSGKTQLLATGRAAADAGWRMIVLAIIIGACWGLFAYAAVFLGAELVYIFVGIFAAVAGVGAVTATVVSVYRRVFHSR